MIELEGVTCIKKDEYCLFHIEQFTDQIKDALRKQLANICYGGEKVSSGSKMYSYRNTVKEFLIRYDGKKTETQEGMIGELLTHLLIGYYFDEYEVVSPFFNMEERSIKKGYDVVLTEKKEARIWLIEVKSGQLHKDKNANQTMLDLLNTAKSDLKSRLNNENFSLWQEAINGAKLAYDSHSSLKDAVVDLLMQYGEEAVEGINNSKDKNVFLSAVLFSKLDDRVLEKTPSDKQKRIVKENIFGKVYALSLQKETFQKVHDFLEDEKDEKK